MISKIAIVLAVVAVALAADGYGKHQVVHDVHGPAYGHPGYGNVKHGPSYKPDDYSEPKPYEFGYSVKDDYNGEHHRQESGDAYGNVKGTYGYTDAYGNYREVEYTADDYGFKANIKTNEQGTDNQNPADVSIYADPAPVKYEPTPKKGYAPHKTAHKVVAHGPSYRAQNYAAPKKGYAPHKTAHKIVAHAPSYRAQSYAAPRYGHALHAVHRVAAPAYGHQSSYSKPVYGTQHGSYATAHQRGYDAHNGGYGHATKVVNHGYGAVAHAPVTHGSYAAATHQRGYDAHDGGYGHATKVVAHGVQYADDYDNHGYGAVAHGPSTHGSYSATHQRGYDAHKGGYGHATKVVTHKVHH